MRAYHRISLALLLLPFGHVLQAHFPPLTVDARSILGKPGCTHPGERPWSVSYSRIIHESLLRGSEEVVGLRHVEVNGRAWSDGLGPRIAVVEAEGEGYTVRWLDTEKGADLS